MNEQDKTSEYKVTCLLPEGLGYGEGSISVEQRLNDPNDPLTSEIIDKVDTIIAGGEILVARQGSDDGCPDGRRAGRFMKGLKFLEHAYNRVKTFGGGLTQSVASQVGLGRAKSGLRKLFKSEADELEKAGIDYGAHTHKNASGDESGCGAIDQAPLIVSNVGVFRKQIKQTIGGLKDLLGRNGVDASDENSNEVLDNFEDYAKEHPNDDYTGRSVIENVLEKERVVAELEDDHLEVAIVINLVEGMTVDQELIRSVTEDVAQVFPIDLPRKMEIADKRYDDEDDSVKSKAVLSMLAYALSTSATLTDGTLRVYVIEPVEESQKMPEPALV